MSTPLIAGIDEAGRGPLAGPVAVAAVILAPDDVPAGLNDSKKLTAAQRKALFGEIMRRALSVSLVFAGPDAIERLNIRGATLDGMRRAARGLGTPASGFLIDGKDVPPGLPAPGRAIIGGDGLEPAISAASIIAKVARDRLMVRLGGEHPDYGFERHMGYGTAEHLAAIDRFGPTVHHRLGFGRLRAWRS